MPTNDERREVAARLRAIETGDFCCCDDYLEALEYAAGHTVGQDYEFAGRLANLIEPEECVLKLTPGGLCPECRKLVGIRESYCGWCGARVVE